MAGWSIPTNGSGLDSAEIIGDNGGCQNLDQPVKDRVAVDDCDDYKVKLRCMFDQLLSVFSEETNERGVIRPMPARLGDGRLLDLFKLFWVVREREGFDFVEKSGLWANVVQELGLDLEVSPSVKLIYIKYLYELEKWLRESSNHRRLENGECESGRNLRLPSEVEAKFRGLFSDGSDQILKDNDLVRSENKANGKSVDKDIEENELSLSDTDNRSRIRDCNGQTFSDDNKNFCDDDKIFDNNNNGIGLGIINPMVAAQEFNSRKRKRDSLVGMLNWVIQIAKCPRDPSIGTIPGPSSWTAQGGSELWIQAIRAREALFHRRHVDSASEESLIQNNQKMHPSMYEDIIVLNQQTTERLRCSERLPTLVNTRLCSCCSSCSKSKLSSPRKIELEIGPKEQKPKCGLKDPRSVTVDSSHTKTEACHPEDNLREKHVSVGLFFQAEVPEWTGVVSDSDPKWLGTRVWPLEHGESNTLVETECIGKGRQDLCGCWLPGSVECIRFHIAEKRLKLKLELGSVFYHWRFDQMGEEVSLRWTVEEEKRFKDILNINPSFLVKGFQNGRSRCFPRKTRENLISYYFNVFLPQRRSYQNRVTPKKIDSDDDESELGAVSGSFGHEAIRVLGSDIVICSQNNQCFDLG